MAKKSMIAREVKRVQKQKRYGQRRDELRRQVVDSSVDDESRWEAMLELQKLPRDSSRSRQRNRCALTGRPLEAVPGVTVIHGARSVEVDADPETLVQADGELLGSVTTASITLAPEPLLVVATP